MSTALPEPTTRPGDIDPYEGDMVADYHQWSGKDCTVQLYPCDSDGEPGEVGIDGGEPMERTHAEELFRLLHAALSQEQEL